MPRFTAHPHEDGVLLRGHLRQDLTIVHRPDLVDSERARLDLLDRKLMEHGYLASEAELWQLLVAVENAAKER